MTAAKYYQGPPIPSPFPGFQKLSWCSFSGCRDQGEGKVTILQVGPGVACFALRSVGMCTLVPKFKLETCLGEKSPNGL